MLNEVPGINRKSHWSDVKKKVRGDPRYERIDSSNQREEWFREHVKTLAKKKEKEVRHGFVQIITDFPYVWLSFQCRNKSIPRW